MHTKLWKRVTDAAGHDNSVLTPDPEIHRKKVMKGNYVFLTELSRAVSYMAKDCSFSIMEEKFRPNDYVVRLQNNSVYTDIVPKM